MPTTMLKSRLEIDPFLGRSLVTSEAVKRGEVVVEESPFAIGPKQNSGIVCLGCYRYLAFGEDGDSMDRCELCDWPLCSACIDAADHRGECEVFSKAKVTFAGNVGEDGVCTQLDCITPLRCLAGIPPPVATTVEMTPSGPQHVITNRTYVRESPVLGRYLTAPDERVRGGDLLIEELPFALGPKCNSRVVCLGCYAPLKCEDGSQDRCPYCTWPLCASCVREDENGGGVLGTSHHRGECVVFQEARAKFFVVKDSSKQCPQLDCITPLRVLLAKEADPERWEKEIAPMEYHDESRRQMTEIWNADRVNIAQYLRGPCKLEQFSEDLIMQVVGILEVNAFEARTVEGYPLRGLYPTTGVLAHNCVPNTARSIYPSEGYRIRLRAMCDLEANQQLHHSYTFTLNGTAQRQEHIKTGKFFTCQCKRCTDPTELGTNFSTFKCSKCEDGWILPQDPLDPSAQWKCNICEFKTSGDAIRKAVEVMQAEVAEVQAMENGAERLQESEKLMRKYRSVLHPLHFILTGLRQNLIEMYGRVEGYEMVELPDVLLERKEELCRQVLRVLNVFEPGLSRTRAMMLYEQHVPLVLLAKSAFIAGALSTEALKSKLQETIEILKECVDILQYEDPASQEGVLGQVAKQALEQLTISVEGLSGQ